MPWQIDPFHTQVEFAAKHFGMMTVRGHFSEVAASGDIDPDNPAASSIEVTAQVPSIKTNNTRRDADLLSSNFLEVDKYPTITFRSTRIEPESPERFAMTGDLTIKATMRPITLQVTRYGEINDARMGHRIAYSAEGEINRRDFGMTLDMMADGRFVVSNEIKVMIEVEMVEQPAQQPAATA